MAAPIPTKPGFYWARWMQASDGTHEGDELTPAREWEIVHVVENCNDETDAEYLAVMVPGVREWQWREDFCWGDFVADERDVNP